MNLATGTVISQLPTGSVIFGNDVFPFTHGITGSAVPQTQQMSFSGLRTGYLNGFYQPTGTTILNSGWVEVNETWTYASATTITVPTDATLTYQKGMKIRFKQGGAYKYFYGKTIAATLLTVTGGSDYSVANSAITDVAYSFIERPFGFPEWFNYTPTLSLVTVGNGTLQGKFKISGLTVKFYAGFSLGSTSAMGSGVPLFSNPVTLLSPVDTYIGKGIILDSGTSRYPMMSNADANSVYCLLYSAGGTYVGESGMSSTAPMTWTTGDAIYVEVEGILA